MAFLSHFALWFILFVLLGRFQEIFPFLAPLQLGKISVAIGLCVVLAQNSKDLGILLRDSPIKIYLLTMIVLAVLGIPFSVYPSSALERCMGFLQLILTASIIVALGKKNMHVTLIGIICILLFISIQMLLSSATGRVAVSATYDPNDIALLCITFLPLAIALFSHKNFIVKVLALTASGGAVASIALSGSRGGFLAMSAVALYSIALLKKRRMLIISLIILGGCVFSAMAGDALWERLQRVVDGTDYNFAEGGGGRMAIWQSGLELVIRRPIFGVGIGQFTVGLGTLTDSHWKAPHNSFLEIAVDLGIGGFLAFCGILIFIYRLSVRGGNAEFLSTQDRNLFLFLRLSLLGYCMAAFLLSQAYGVITYTLFSLSVVMHLFLTQKEKAAQYSPKTQEETSPSHTFAQHSFPGQHEQHLPKIQQPRLSSARMAQLEKAEQLRRKKKACLDNGDMLLKKKHTERIK